MSSVPENNLTLIPELDGDFQTNPFLRYNLGNGDVIKMVEKTRAAGVFIRTRELLGNKFESNNPVILPDFENDADHSSSQMSVDSSETSEMDIPDIEEQSDVARPESESDSNDPKTKWSPMFVPSTRYDRLVLFKSVSKKNAKRSSIYQIVCCSNFLISRKRKSYQFFHNAARLNKN